MSLPPPTISVLFPLLIQHKVVYESTQQYFPESNSDDWSNSLTLFISFASMVVLKF